MLAPTRDVTVEYQVVPPEHVPLAVQVAIAAGGMRLHIVGEDLPTTFLVDRNSEIADITLPLFRTYTRVDIGRYDPTHTILRGAAFSRGGESRVAGLACTIWHATSPSGFANACITPDGVILEGSATSNRKGALGTIRAQFVHYGPLPADLFDVPPDFSESPLGQAAAQFLK